MAAVAETPASPLPALVGALQKGSAWLIAVLATLPSIFFWQGGLTDLDEGFYGAVVRDMLRRGDAITPTLNGVPWFEKPILSYWLAMPTVALFPNEFGARLPSYLCTLATAYVVYQFAFRHFSRATATLATFAYGGSLLVAILGRMMMTDPAFVLCLTLAFTLFYDSLVGDSRLRIGTAAFLGLSTLAKGPVGVVLFFIAAGILYARVPRLREAFKGHWLVGFVVFLAVVSTWYVPCYLANGQVFIQKFLIEQNIGRFAGGDKAHTVPAWLNPIFYIPVIALALIPWVTAAITGLVRRRKNDDWPEETFAVRQWLWIWAAVIVGLFTVSGTKLVHYIAPALVPLAILAVWLPQENGLTFRNWRRVLVWLPMAMTLTGAGFTLYSQAQFGEVQHLARSANRIPEPLIIFQTGRPADEEIKIGLEMQDTSNPSVLFYYQRRAVDTGDTATLKFFPLPALVLMPKRARTPELEADLQTAGRAFEPAFPGSEGERYALYRIIAPANAAR